MKRFSQRKGLTLVKTKFQKNNIDKDLKTGIWNTLITNYWKGFNEPLFRAILLEIDPDYYERLIKSIWINYFKYPIDELPSSDFNSRIGSFPHFIKEWIFSCKWYEIYDFIEFVANEKSVSNKSKNFQSEINNILEREISSYRFIDGIITEITSDEEIKAIDEVIQLYDFFITVTEHIKTALKHLADRKKPDYRNSIKESISGVEGLCKLIAKDKNADLHKALKKIEKKLKFAPALKSGLSKIYGYASSEGGIRHALSEETDIDFEDAKFMLVSCSAFIHYLILKANKAGIF